MEIKIEMIVFKSAKTEFCKNKLESVDCQNLEKEKVVVIPISKAPLHKMEDIKDQEVRIILHLLCFVSQHI